MPSTLRLLVFWLVVFCLALNGLLPLGAHAALAAPPAAPAICSTVPHEKGNAPGHTIAHDCSHCCAGGHAPVLPELGGAPIPRNVQIIERSTMRQVVARARPLSDQAQPRAPPAFPTLSPAACRSAAVRTPAAYPVCSFCLPFVCFVVWFF